MALTDATRFERAKAAAAAAGIDALLIGPGADLRYLTGYNALPLPRLTCLVVPTSGEAALYVPRLEEPRALASAVTSLPVTVTAWEETEDPVTLIETFVSKQLGHAPQTVAVSDRMWAMHVLRFEETLQSRVVSAASVMRQLRIRKTADEIAALDTAARAIDSVHEQIRGWSFVDRSEQDIGADIAEAIVAAGHEHVNFVIVGSGPNGASPHHELSERRVVPGDVVVVDIGGAIPQGYCSDSTRTYVVGEPPAGFLDYYRVLYDAQIAACEAVRPGIAAQDVDRAARQLINDAGYGDYFIHRTGHGIGLEEHEDPFIVTGNDTMLEPGMCFSIEPGIYLPGKHGARIEDIVTVTEKDGRRLNTIDRDFVVVDA